MGSAAAILQLRSAKQKDGESTLDFEQRLWKLCTVALPNERPSVMDREVRLSFINGLASRKLREHITLKEVNNMTEVRKFIALWEHSQQVGGKDLRFEGDTIVALGEEGNGMSKLLVVNNKKEKSEEKEDFKEMI